jgi:hypothetical protein
MVEVWAKRMPDGQESRAVSQVQKAKIAFNLECRTLAEYGQSVLTVDSNHTTVLANVIEVDFRTYHNGCPLLCGGPWFRLRA